MRVRFYQVLAMTALLSYQNIGVVNAISLRHGTATTHALVMAQIKEDEEKKEEEKKEDEKPAEEKKEDEKKDDKPAEEKKGEKKDGGDKKEKCDASCNTPCNLDPHYYYHKYPHAAAYYGL